MQSAVIVFPGSNCDRDVAVSIKKTTNVKPFMVWHQDNVLPKVDLVVIPGGFSYGDYLRPGAMATYSPIIQEVKKHAEKGGYVLGICNGFQILCETGLLPGVLMRNKGLKFICKPVPLYVENTNSVFTSKYTTGQIIQIPIAHGDGNFYADEETLNKIENEGQVAFRYCDLQGNINEDTNPNGSSQNIAGIFNLNKNILGMMPHPERAADPLLAGTDGKTLFESITQ